MIVQKEAGMYVLWIMTCYNLPVGENSEKRDSNTSYILVLNFHNMYRLLYIDNYYTPTTPN